MRAFDLRPMSAGEVLDRAFQVYRSNFGPFFLTAFVVFVPMGLLYAVAGFEPSEQISVTRAVGSMGLLVLFLVVSVVSWAALTWEVEWAMSGDPVSVQRGYRRALGSAFGLVGLWIVVYVGAIVATMLAFVPGILLGVGVAFLPLPETVGVVLGAVFALSFVAFVLIWVGAVAAIATPVLVLEGVGVFAALKRAHALTKGARIRVGGLMALAWLIVILPTLGVLIAMGMASVLWDPEAVGQMTTAQLYLQQLVGAAIGSITTPYMVAVMVMLYYDRRVRREGYDVELASRDLT